MYLFRTQTQKLHHKTFVLALQHCLHPPPPQPSSKFTTGHLCSPFATSGLSVWDRVVILILGHINRTSYSHRENLFITWRFKMSPWDILYVYKKKKKKKEKGATGLLENNVTFSNVCFSWHMLWINRKWTMERNGLPHVALDGFSVDIAQTLDYICVCRWGTAGALRASHPVRRIPATCTKVCAQLTKTLRWNSCNSGVDLHMKFHDYFFCCISSTQKPAPFAEPKSNRAQSETRFLLKPPTLPADCCTAAPELQL